jgi:hypothetical protein
MHQGLAVVGLPVPLPALEADQHGHSRSHDEQCRCESQDGEGRVARLHPSPGAALQHTENTQPETGRGEKGADAVQPGTRAGTGGFRDHAAEEQDSGDDHHLTGEDQPPGEVGRHPAAQQGADRDPRPGQSADDTVGDGPVLPAVGLGDEGRHGRQHHRGPESFDDRPAQRQDPQGGGCGGESRPRGVHSEADEEDATSSDDVSDPPSDDHEGRHDQRVQRDDRLNGGDLGVEVLDQLADGDIHDGCVQDHQELRGTQDDQSTPVRHGVHLADSAPVRRHRQPTVAGTCPALLPMASGEFLRRLTHGGRGGRTAPERASWPCAHSRCSSRARRTASLRRFTANFR